MLLLLGSAFAGNLTYCVGGYQGQPPGLHATACGETQVRVRHPLFGWHSHSFVMKDGVCYECWDEVDDSCDTDFLPKNPDYRKVAASKCPSQNNSSEVVSHVIGGSEVASVPKEDCSNGLDDDGDGPADCEDPECRGEAVCIELCTDGQDNDRDGAVDCDDGDCRDDESCGPLGISLDLSGLPTECWAEGVCNGAVRIDVADGPRKADAQALLQSAELILEDEGVGIPINRQVERTYPTAGARHWRFILKVPGEPDLVVEGPPQPLCCISRADGGEVGSEGGNLPPGLLGGQMGGHRKCSHHDSWAVHHG